MHITQVYLELSLKLHFQLRQVQFSSLAWDIGAGLSVNLGILPSACVLCALWKGCSLSCISELLVLLLYIDVLIHI